MCTCEIHHLYIVLDLIYLGAPFNCLEPCESPNQSDCEYNATTTTYEADADVSDPTLQVTKKEKLKTKKKRDKITTKIEKSLTRKKLRKQLEELEMTPLLIDTSSSSNLDKTEDPSGDEVKIKKHKATRKSKDKQDRLNSKEKTIATLDKTEDLSEDEDTFKKYSSTKAARKSSDKQRRSKTKTRTTSSKIHSSSDEAVCLIQSDMDADNERTNSSSPVSEHTPSNERHVGGATLDVSEKKRKTKLKKSQTSKSKAQKSKWEALDEERRMKRNEARRLRRQKRKV